MTLLHVPPIRLLLIQRVNKQFRDTISISNPLHQKLFFKADHNTDKEISNAVEWYPFIRDLKTEWERTHYYDCRKFHMTDLSNIDPNASWKRIFVKQPPPSHVTMTRYSFDSSSHVVSLAAVAAKEGSGGCTMDDLCEYDWEEDLLGNDCYIRVRVKISS